VDGPCSWIYSFANKSWGALYVAIPTHMGTQKPRSPWRLNWTSSVHCTHMRDIIEGKVCMFISSDVSNMLNTLGSLFGWEMQNYESSNGWMHVI